MKLTDLPPGRFKDAAMAAIKGDDTLPASGNVTVYLPIQTVSEANQREHWGAKGRRVKKQRAAACEAITTTKGVTTLTRGESSLCVTLTRIRPKGRRQLDPDNLAGSFKAIQDGIADALGIDDGSNRLRWAYQQENGAAYGVRILIAPA